MARVDFDKESGRGSAANESVLIMFRRITEGDNHHDVPDMVGGIYVEDIRRRAGGARGRATAVLKALTGWADWHRETLFLMPVGSTAIDELSPEALHAWYMRQGFSWYGLNPDLMVRYPTEAT